MGIVLDLSGRELDLMDMKNLRMVLWGVVAIATGVAGGIAYISATTPASKSVVSQISEIGGEFDLVNHNGEPVTQADLSGSPTVLFFGFTHCPEICPTTLGDVDGWLQTLGKEGRTVKAYFVTVDPERDGPEIMKDYVTSISDRITGLTGTPAQVEQIQKNYRIFSRKVRLGDGDYTMDHTASVLLLDEKGRFVSTISYGEPSDIAVEKLRKLVSNTVS